MSGKWQKETFTKVDRDGGIYTRTKITSDLGTYECENYTSREQVYGMFNACNCGMHESSYKKMYEAYADYRKSREWD